MNFRKPISGKYSLIIIIISLFLNTSLFAQVSAIDPNNLSNIKVAELTDEQILQILKQGQASGISIDQAELIATKRGLSSTEAALFKTRAIELQNKSVSPNINSTNLGTDNAQVVVDVPNKTQAIGRISNKDTTITEKELSVYGQEYFRKGNIKIFDKASDAKAPSNYVIGIGDELGVSVFGFSYFNEVLKVDARGAINPSQIGPIFVKGLTFERAKVLIRSKFSQYYDLSNNRLEVTLSYSRIITVNIVGEVVNPGSYKIPALNTAFNALIIAGGPSNLGSLRNIQIKREGKIVRTLDVYAFLNDPNSKQDFFLEENDYIFVPTSQKVVGLWGDIKRDTNYELLPNENLVSILKYAGGLKSTAYTQKIQIKRRTPKEVILIDLNLDSIIKFKKDFDLRSGDNIYIKSSITDVLNKVTISGAINFPGDYKYEKGQKVSDLVDIAGGLKFESELENAYIIRTNSDQTKEYLKINLKNITSSSKSVENILLKPLDVVTIYSNKSFINDFYIGVNGAVKEPKRITYTPGMTLNDAIRQTSGFSFEAENLRIELSRLSYFSDSYTDGQEVRIMTEKIQLKDLSLNLTDAILGYKLQPFDEIYIRSVPNFSPIQNFQLNGEVKYPGSYSLLNKEERISNAIKRAGGLTMYAFPEAATLYRPNLEGNLIVLRLDKVLKNENSKYNYVLKQGDILSIPTVTDFVAIKGTSVEYLKIVNQTQINAPYVAGRRANYYIRNFGNGFSKDAWKRKTYVVQPNAKVNRTRNFIVFKVYPKVTKGSTIYVIGKVKKEKTRIRESREEFNWNKFIENTMVKVTGVATLYLLLRQL